MRGEINLNLKLSYMDVKEVFRCISKNEREFIKDIIRSKSVPAEKPKRIVRLNNNIFIEQANDFYEYWNQLVFKPIPSLRSFSGKRKKNTTKLIKTYGLNELKQVLGLALSSDFLTGKKTSWKMSYDFFVNENNFLKIKEGNYDNNEINTKSKNDLAYLMEDDF